MIAVVADDVTGATDVAAAFRRRGLRTAIVFGVPAADTIVADSDVVVIALKSRTAPPDEAVTASVASMSWAQRRGFDQFFFKCCSTFDSTPAGNIGPVADALAERLGEALVIVTPASPRHERTVYEGALFVGSQLLSESSMRTHPLTPMTDANLVRVLGAQSGRRVGLVRHGTVARGIEAVEVALERLMRDGYGHAIVDAIDDADIATIGSVAGKHRFVVGAAGLADGIATALTSDRRADDTAGDPIPDLGDYRRAAVLSGSCSPRTVEQVNLMTRDTPSYRLDPLASASSDALAAAALRWFDELPDRRTPLFYSSVEPRELAKTQAILGVATAAELVEGAMAQIARGLLERGVNRLVVAGGETSGSVTAALDVTTGIVGIEEAAGVPWIFADAGHPIALLLKSGNFGDPGLLARAGDPQSGPYD